MDSLAYDWGITNMHVSDMIFNRFGNYRGVVTTRCGTISSRNRQVGALPCLIAPFMCQ